MGFWTRQAARFYKEIWPTIPGRNVGIGRERESEKGIEKRRRRNNRKERGNKRKCRATTEFEIPVDGFLNTERVLSRGVVCV